MAMTAAVKALETTQVSMIAELKSDRFLADAHWDIVRAMSEIKNPYANRDIKVHYSILNVLMFLRHWLCYELL